MTDLERAYKALKAKSPVMTRYYQYYEGDQPTVYTAKRLEEIFQGLDANFTQNWCAVVVDSVRDRINLRNITVSSAADAWQAIMDDNQLLLESDDVHEAALVTGEAFYIAWPDEDGNVQGFANDPWMCHVFYRADNPRQKEFAAKWFRAGDELRLTLYYPDRLEYYTARQKEGLPENANAFRPAEPDQAENPYGMIPVFHFRLGRRPHSDLKNVLPIQNGINKLLADMMVAAEYGAFKQRWVISNAEELGKLKNAPNEVWSIPAGDGVGQQTTVGQFDATPLKNYLDAIDSQSMAISSITRTPKHYFFSIGSNLSGEALNAMETPLNKKAQDRIDRFMPEWRAVTQFMLRVAGFDVPMSEVLVEFDRPELVQPRSDAETTQMEVNAGIPLRTAVRRRGWSDAQIAQMEQDRADEKAAEQASLATALLDAQRRLDQGNNSLG